MADLLKKTVTIKEPRHFRLMGETFGLIEARLALEEIEKESPKLPGIRLALAEIEARTHAKRAELAVANIRLAAAEGIDVSVWAVTGIERGGVVVLEPFPDEQGEA